MELNKSVGTTLSPTQMSRRVMADYEQRTGVDVEGSDRARVQARDGRGDEQSQVN